MLNLIRDLVAWAPIGIPAFLFVIALVIFFHELGHFLVARACGVAVETFSFGFGGEIFGWNDKTGTRWKICWLPLGGYVKFKGDENAASVPDTERIARMSPEERVGAFPLKPLWQRMLVVAAGPVANFVLAFVFFAALLGTVGAPGWGTYIGAVEKNTPAAEAGLKPGDRIAAVNGKPVKLFIPELQSLIRNSAGKSLELTVERSGQTLRLHVTPRWFPAKDIFGSDVNVLGIGILPADSLAANTVYIPVPLEKVPQIAALQCWRIVDASLITVWRIVSHKADASQVGGPIGMAKMAKSAASHGFYELIYLVAFISVSIGLINLFPIPLLDGGHLLYYACEGVLGRPLSERTQDVGFRIGLALVIGIFIFATWNDLVR